MVSISEFEKNKPTVTHKKIKSLIRGYEKSRDRLSGSAGDVGRTLCDIFDEIIVDLKSIEESFLKGE